MKHFRLTVFTPQGGLQHIDLCIDLSYDVRDTFYEECVYDNLLDM